MHIQRLSERQEPRHRKHAKASLQMANAEFGMRNSWKFKVQGRTYIHWQASKLACSTAHGSSSPRPSHATLAKGREIPTHHTKSEEPQHRPGECPQVAQILLKDVEDLAVVELPIHVHQEISKPLQAAHRLLDLGAARPDKVGVERHAAKASRVLRRNSGAMSR